MENLVQCPICKNVFDHNETFDYMCDNEGHPTVEFLSCPKCDVATHNHFNCEVCSGQQLCKRTEECLACFTVRYEDFISIDDDISNYKPKKTRKETIKGLKNEIKKLKKQLKNKDI